MEVNNKDHVIGSPNSTVVLIEYGDYQCPFCRKAYYMVKEIHKQLGNNLKFVFRNFPLTELHEHAYHAALAAEAANEQDRFWEMHETLFENQRALDDYSLMRYAEEVGLDMARFQKDFGDEKCRTKVEQDYESGLHHRVEGTPTFFVNGQHYEGNFMSPDFIDYLKGFITEDEG